MTEFIYLQQLGVSPLHSAHLGLAQPLALGHGIQSVHGLHGLHH